METLAQKWIKEGVGKGVEKGVEAQRQTLLRLAKWRFALSVAAEQRYAQQLAQIRNLDHLLHLVDQLLITEDVADFDQALRAYLPPAEASR